MDTWTELIDGPIKLELLQSEMLFQEMIESIPLIAISAIAIFFGFVGLLAVMDHIFSKDRDLQQSNKGCETEEKYPRPATRLLMNDVNAAA